MKKKLEVFHLHKLIKDKDQKIMDLKQMLIDIVGNEQDKIQRQEKAMALTMQGMPSRALDRLAGPPLAADTLETEDIMRSKFIQPPDHQAYRERSQVPPANVLTETIIAKTILSFQKGLGGGPSGLRPDLLKQIIGKKADRLGIVPVTEFCN